MDRLKRLHRLAFPKMLHKPGARRTERIAAAVFAVMWLLLRLGIYFSGNTIMNPTSSLTDQFRLNRVDALLLLAIGLYIGSFFMKEKQSSNRKDQQ